MNDGADGVFILIDSQEMHLAPTGALTVVAGQQTPGYRDGPPS